PDRSRKKRTRSLHPSSITTRRPSLPIVSSLKALFAQWLFHPRTPVRSFVSLLYCLPPGIRCNRPHLCQVLCVTSVPHPTCKRLRGSIPSASRNDSAPALERCQCQRGGD